MGSDLDHGDTFDEVIQQNLDAARCVMVLWSSKSVKSENNRAEATYGKDWLVPVLIEEVKIPVPFNLIQTAYLIGWKGDQTDPEFLKLLESVSKKVGRSPTNKKKDENPSSNENNSSGNSHLIVKVYEGTMLICHFFREEEKDGDYL